MIVVNILGGLGNQLNAYACAYSVAHELKQPLVLDISDYYGGYFRPYALDELNIPEHLKIYYPHRYVYYHGIYAAPENFIRYFDEIVDTAEVKTRDELIARIAGKKNVYIQGYGGLDFVKEKDKPALRQLFQLRHTDKVFDKIVSEITSSESVSIHIRRTDFIDNGWDTAINYYKAAIVYMNNLLDNMQLYIFSDDIEWSRDNLGICENYHFVHLLGGMESDIREMYYMSACRHHILTNKSTFGFWAAFLSASESAINIINGNDTIIEVPGRHILDQRTILELASLYDTHNIPIEQNIDTAYLEKCLLDNDNYSVINYIDNLGINYSNISDKEKTALLEYKGIAYLQEGDAVTSLSIFHHLQQKSRDNADFCYNYSVALMNAGYRLESLIYSGCAMRMNNNINAEAYLGDIDNTEADIIKLVQNIPLKHFVFLNLPIYENVKGYYESAAIMLKNLGHMVTILEFGSDDIISHASDFNDYIEIINASKVYLDKVYDWGITKYCIGRVADEATFSQITEALFCSLENIVFVTHYLEGAVAKSTSSPLIFFDAFSVWDDKKLLMDEYSASSWEEIYNASSKVITYREMPSEHSAKRLPPFAGAAKTDTYKVNSCKERTLDKGFYMRNEECLWGMLSLLKATADID